MNSSSPMDAHAFFLPATGGGRYCVYYAVPETVLLRGSVLLIPPFGEELNRTRRLAAQQARLLAAQGIAVLQIDLYGCGDSAGELRDVSWDMWLDDLEAAHAWITTTTKHNPVLLAVRLGALLAIDLAARLTCDPNRLLLWAPVTNGLLFARQFLRQHVAGQIVGDNAEPVVDTTALRKKLLNGETIEIAGYELSPELFKAIETSSAVGRLPRCARIDWFDVNTTAAQSTPIATRQLIDAWSAEQIHVQHRQVNAQQFWAIQDTTECPKLLNATCAALSSAEQ